MTEALAVLPPPLDHDTVDRAWTDLRGTGTDLAAFEAKRPLIDAVFGGSPFLRDLILRDSDFAGRILVTDPDSMLAELIDGLAAEVADEPEMRRLLRKTRGRAALTIALADLGGVWSLDQVTDALTRFAEAMLNAAVEWLLSDQRRAGKLLSASGE